MGARPLTRWRSRALQPVVALALLILTYLIAGAVGGLVPRHGDRRPPPRGITIWVEDNGIHTGIVMPVRAAGIDWGHDFPATDLRDPRYARHDYIAVGWGERDFYIGTPTWRELRLLTVIHAALGSDDTLLHVEHIARPVAGPHLRSVTLRVEEYRRLAAAIWATRRPGAATAGYGAYDAFYPANGRYDALHTCNVWTGDTLAATGLRVGVWTPFPSTVMRWF